jgi:hypothetical protein
LDSTQLSQQHHLLAQVALFLDGGSWFVSTGWFVVGVVVLCVLLLLFLFSFVVADPTSICFSDGFSGGCVGNAKVFPDPEV